MGHFSIEWDYGPWPLAFLITESLWIKDNIIFGLCGEVGFHQCFTHFIQFPARGSTQVLLCFFPGVLWLWHFLHVYSVGPHPVSSLHIYTFVVSRAFMAGVASQAGDADSFRTWSHLWFAGVRECPPWCSFVGATVTVYQFFCFFHVQ